MTETHRQRVGAQELDAQELDAPDDVASLATEVIDVSDAPPIVPAPPLSKSEVRTILLSLMLTMFLTALDQTIVATALPTIGRQFQDVTSLSWVITAYLLSSTAVAPVYGTLSDIYGRRAMIIVSMTLFLIGSVLCAVAPNLLTLIFARALQGIGGGGILPLVQTVISDVVTPRERGQYQAYFSSVWVAAGIGGPILGGLFAEHLHWSVIFWINLPLGALSLVLLLPRMGKIPVFHRKRKVDWLGGVLLMAAAVIVMLVLTWGGNRFAWASPAILAMLGSAMVLAAAFVWHALRTEEPFLPIPLLSGPVVPFAMTAGGCAVGAMIALTVHMPLYYEVVHGLSASEAGLALIPLVAVSVLGAWAAGRAMTYTRHYTRAAIVGATLSVLAAITMAVATPLPLWQLLALLSLFAAGLGTVFPVTVVSIQNAVPRAQVGTATGAMNFFRSLTASFAVAVFTAILLMVLGKNISIGAEQSIGAKYHAIAAAEMIAAFRYVFAAAAVLLAFAATVLVLMEERPLAGPQQRAAEMAE
ncbi:MAG TPA: MDR family MFS transporter [Afipia sp.]